MSATRTGGPIRVVVVDDSVLMRTMLKSGLEADGDISVVAAAREPYEARNMIKATDPDVVTLDVEMPGMNGLEFLEKIMRLRPTPVVMVSSLTSEGAEATLTALEYGAVDFAAKPAGNQMMKEFGDTLRQKVRAASRARVRQRAAAPAQPHGAQARGVQARGVQARGPAAMAGAAASNLIAIGASTGGVAAIGSIVSRLPKQLPPIIAVVHMPEKYTGRFASRLAAQTGHDVAEAREGEVLSTGMIRIAPGGAHLTIDRAGSGFATRIGHGEAVSGHRPSIDVCFSSVAKVAGDRALGVILTGMGRDGAQGLLQMRQAGAVGLGEAESSCVVYGMPKAAKSIGAVAEELDLERMPERICDLISRSARARSASVG